jgi:D-cysteine desulfhydrase
VLVAAGSVSSNFCAAAAVAARRCGLDCELLLSESASAAGSTNVAIARAVGARLLFDAAPTRETLEDVLWDRVDALRAAGRQPYPLPRGGATPIGAVGYAFAAQEIAEQVPRWASSSTPLLSRPDPVPLRLDSSLARRDTDFRGTSSAHR